MMPRAEDPEARDLLRRQQSRKEAEAAEAALGRLLVSIEKGEAAGGMLDSYSAALRRHGKTIRNEGGAALLRITIDRLCHGVSLGQASARWDLLIDAWGGLLSKGGKP